MCNRYLFITRGLPGAGKSTFVKNFLQPTFNVIESDKIRIIFNGFNYENGKKTSINQSNSKMIWSYIDNLLRLQLKKTSVVLDSTAIEKNFIDKYIKIAKSLNAIPIIIDFSSVPFNVCKEQNSKRLPEYKRVSEKTLNRMYKRLEFNNKIILKYDNLIPFEEFTIGTIINGGINVKYRKNI